MIWMTLNKLETFTKNVFGNKKILKKIFRADKILGFFIIFFMANNIENTTFSWEIQLNFNHFWYPWGPCPPKTILTCSATREILPKRVKNDLKMAKIAYFRQISPFEHAHGLISTFFFWNFFERVIHAQTNGLRT